MKLYFPAINLLRGIAALLVCIYHFTYFNSLNNNLFDPNGVVRQISYFGSEGVFLFFVISGFVIPLSLFKYKFTFKRFPNYILRRFIRIEIPYFFSIFLVLAVGVLFALKNGTSFSFHLSQFLYHLVYLIPFTKFDWYNVIYWTLAIEFQFYIFIGLIFFLLQHKNKTILLLTLVTFGASNFFVHDNRFLFNYASIFLMGIVLCLFLLKKLKKIETLTLLLICFVSTIYIQSLSIAIISILAVIYIYYVKIDSELSNRMGVISYSLYLTHGVIGGNIIYACARYVDSFYLKAGLVIIALLFSVFFSYFFWQIIEAPSQKLSKKIRI